MSSNMSLLCETCQNFNIQAFPKGDFQHQSRLYPKDGVVSGARSGCGFCTMICENLMRNVEINPDLSSKGLGSWAVSRMNSRHLLNPVSWLLQAWEEISRFKIWVHFHAIPGREHGNVRAEGLNIASLFLYIQEPSGATSIWLHLAADQGTPAQISHDITGRLLTERPALIDSYISDIKSWHSQCAQDHPECRKTLSKQDTFDVDDVLLPTRCYEVSLHPQANNRAIQEASFRLCETTGKKGKYIILSHRWDDSTEKAKTLKSNLDCRLGCCQSCQDPATRCSHNMDPSPLFKDASILAAKLGVKYIWIDSLCIVQDDAEDWERESVKMGQYYQYAWVTISATLTSDKGRLFQPIKPEALPRVTRLPYRGPDGIQNGHFYVQCVGPTTLARDYKDSVAESELLKRGWVYQEWMLSRRVLTFSAAGIFFQCQKGIPMSTLGDSISDLDERNKQGNEETGIVDLAFKESMKIDFTSETTLWSSWEKVVETYSGLGLTNITSDRIVALGGVAQEFGLALQRLHEARTAQSSRLSHSYLCGHWYGDHRGLLWQQVSPGPRVRLKGIPSWSWASMATRSVNEKGKEVLSGMPVRWSEIDRPYLARGAVEIFLAETACSFISASTIEVDKAMKPLFHTSRSLLPQDVYSNDNRFVMPRLQGKLLQVAVDGSIMEKPDETSLTALTAYSSDFGKDMWRPTTTWANRETIRGWASIEHPEYQEDNLKQLQTIEEVYALPVTKIPKVYGGYGFGKFSRYQPAFQVLYLKPINIAGTGECYERLGVGRMFGYDVEANLALLEERSLWLV